MDLNTERISASMKKTETRVSQKGLVFSAIAIFMSGVFSCWFWWTGAGIIFLLNTIFCLICVLVAVKTIYQQKQLTFNSINQDETQPETDS
ncbi:hypothetical protein [uncultured Gimesia sp.]|uniref:hypothetical protein n=1 Tax=uncultured Gimesia sp. TaxID=1678688 RepID=UPI0026204DC8|nr:hypothetical protein [uncultured Gimesia sp.]